MRRFGGERVIRSLLVYPNISARAIISTLPIKLEEDLRRELWRDYIAKGIRIISVNTANFAGGTMLSMDFSDIIDSSKDDKESTDGEATKSICRKLKEKGEDVSESV